MTSSRMRRRRRVRRRLRTLTGRSRSRARNAARLASAGGTSDGARAARPRPTVRPSAYVSQIAPWPPRRWLVAAGVAVAVAVATGVPTDVVPNPLFTRMMPVTWWNYPILAVSAVLAGLVAATYVRIGPTPRGRRQAGTAAGGGVLSLFAVGCPICNKLVVAALGAGGALSYFGPAQPVLGVTSVVLLGAALALRLRALAACSVPVSDGLRPVGGT
jgi:hypothetical protein